MTVNTYVRTLTYLYQIDGELLSNGASCLKCHGFIQQNLENVAKKCSCGNIAIARIGNLLLHCALYSNLYRPSVIVSTL